MPDEKLDREAVLSRRRALMLMAAASTGCGPSVCLSVAPDVCLSVEAPPCPQIRQVTFSGPATALDAHALAQIDKVAAQIKAEGMYIRLHAAVFDDGHAADAAELHEPRVAAVEKALADRGVDNTNVTRHQVAAALIKPETWLSMTNDGNPLTLSGMVQFLC